MEYECSRQQFHHGGNERNDLLHSLQNLEEFNLQSSKSNMKIKKISEKTKKQNKKTETKNKRKIIKTLMKWFLITMQIIFTDKYFCFIRWRNVNFVMVVVPRICRPLQPIKFLTFLSQSVNSPEISAEPFIQPNGVDFSFSFPCFAFCDN